MERLNLPPYNIRIRTSGGQNEIFDILRKRYVALTPEEWVRQHFIHYLTEHMGYPEHLMQNEVELRCGQKRLRCDSMLYSRDGTPRMIIEYKAPSVSINSKVFDQIATYNILLHVEYLIVSNGINHYCCRMDYETGSFHFLESIPHYDEIRNKRQ